MLAKDLQSLFLSRRALQDADLSADLGTPAWAQFVNQDFTALHQWFVDAGIDVEGTLSTASPSTTDDSASTPAFNATGVFTVQANQIPIAIATLFDGREFPFELGLVNLRGMAQFADDPHKFVQEAVRRIQSQSNLGYTLINEMVFASPDVAFPELAAGEQFALLMTEKGAIADLVQNPEAAIFSFQSDVFARVTEGNNVLSFTVSGTHEQDTLILKVEGATVPAIPVENVLPSEQSWTQTQWGQAIQGAIASSNHTNTADFDPTDPPATHTPPVSSDSNTANIADELDEFSSETETARSRSDNQIVPEAPAIAPPTPENTAPEVPPTPHFPLPTPETATPQPGIFTVGESGHVSVDFYLDGGAYESELAIFSLEGMELSQAGTKEFAQEAARRALSNSHEGFVAVRDREDGAKYTANQIGTPHFNQGDYRGPKAGQLTPGSQFGMMLVPLGTVADIAAGRERPIFSFDATNPLADITGDGQIFGFEDLRLGSQNYDGDFNDIIFHVQGATGLAPSIDEQNQKHWHEKPQTKELIELIQKGSDVVTYSDRFLNPTENFSLIGRADAPELVEKVEVWLRNRHSGDWEIVQEITDFDEAGRFKFEQDGRLPAGNYEVKTITQYQSGLSEISEARDFTVLSLPHGEELSDRVKMALTQSTNLKNYDAETLSNAAEWLVRVHQGYDATELAAQFGATFAESPTELSDKWTFSSVEDQQRFVEYLAENSAIAFAYPLLSAPVDLYGLPNDGTEVTQQWHLVPSHSPLTAVWDKATGRNVTIAIADVGFEVADPWWGTSTHDDLKEVDHGTWRSGYQLGLSKNFDEKDDDTPSRYTNVENKLRRGQLLRIEDVGASIENVEDLNSATDFDNRYVTEKLSLNGVIAQLTVNFELGNVKPGQEYDVYLVGNQTNKPVHESRIKLGTFTENDEYPIQVLDPYQDSNVDPVIWRSQSSWMLEVVDRTPGGAAAYLEDFSVDLVLVNDHGTQVAGVAAATGNNGIGGAGVAYDAQWAALQLGADGITEVEARALQHNHTIFDIYQNSWGFSEFYHLSPESEDSIEDGIEQGREGKGNVYVFAAGNHNVEQGNYDARADYNSLASHRQTIAVGAVAKDGLAADYSVSGASILVSAYSGNNIPTDGVDDIITTTYNNQYSNPTNQGYFSGTSAAAPYVSGVVALMLEERPDLTWRDVQWILALSAHRSEAMLNDPDAGWTEEQTLREQIIRHSHKYGFGLVDPVKAFELLEQWDSIGNEATLRFHDDETAITPGGIIPTSDNAPISTIKVEDDFLVESVEIEFYGHHQKWSEVEIKLKSPTGVLSTLALPHNSGGNIATIDDGSALNYTFSSVRHWGESANGMWELYVSDPEGGASGELGWWELKIYEAETNTPPVVTPINQNHTYTVNQSIELTDIVITDADGDNISVILSLSDSAAGNISAGGSSSNNGVLVLDGTADEVTTALQSLVFTPANGFTGDVQITTSVNDGHLANPIAGAINLSTVPPVNVSLIPGSQDASEDGATGSFTIIRDGDTTQPLTVAYQFSGTAENGQDYDVPESVTFAAGETFKVITVEPTDDLIYEGTETVTVELVAGAGYIPNDTFTSHTINIADNEPVPPVAQVTLQALDQTASEDGDAAVFYVERDGDTSQDLTVNYGISGEVDGNDLPLMGSVVIAAGETRAVFGVSAFYDSDRTEDDETFTVSLTNGAGYQAGSQASSTATLVDSDRQWNYGPFVHINPANGHQYVVSEIDSWHGAQAQAKALGGNLVAINDQAENDWLVNTFKDTTFWLGMTDSEFYGASEGSFQWVNGEAVNFSNWRSGEPNNVGGGAGEDFGEFSTAELTNGSQQTRQPYTFQSGDTLWSIAQRYLGTGFRWREIQKANGSSYADGTQYNIPVGTVVYIPTGSTPIRERGLWNDVVAQMGHSLTGLIEIDPDQLAKPIVNVKVTDYGADEDGNSGQVIFTRVGDIFQALTVEYTVGGSATNGADFQALSGSVTFEAGQLITTVGINPLGDFEADGLEDVTITLKDTGAYDLGLHRTGQVWIEELHPINQIARDAIGRDVSLFSAWEARFDAGESLDVLRRDIIASAVDGNGNLDVDARIDEAHLKALGRSATAAEVAAWRSQIEGGTTLSEMSQTLAGISSANFIDAPNPVYFNSDTGNYYFLTAQDTWLGAQEQAVSFGGNLVTINDADERSWLFSTFGLDSDYWIGFTDSEVASQAEGDFAWVNGEATTYKEWIDNEPSDRDNINDIDFVGGEDFAHIRSYWGGGWNDSSLADENGNYRSWQGIVEVSAAAFNSAPTLTQIDTFTGATQFQVQTITYADLLAASDATDADGDAISFRIEGLGDGLLELNGNSVTIGQTLVGPGDELKWIPKSAGDGALGFTVSATDGQTFSSGKVDVNFDVIANSEPVVVGPEFQVNTVYAQDNQRAVHSDKLSDGRIVTVWNSDREGTYGADVWVKIYSDDLQTSINEFKTDISSWNIPSDVKALSDGGFVVVWNNLTPFGWSGYGQKYNRDGDSVGNKFEIPPPQGYLNVVTGSLALSNGEFMVFYHASAHIFGQRYSQKGELIGDSIQISPDSYLNSRKPVVSSLENGGFIVLWKSDGENGSDRGIFGKLYDMDFSAIGSEFRVYSDVEGDSQNVAVSSLSDGSFAVVWESDQQIGTGQDIFLQRFSSEGVANGQRVRVNEYTESDQQNPQIVGLKDGGFVVTWNSLNQDGDGEGVFGKRFDAEGVVIGQEFKINEVTSGDQKLSSISVLDSEELLISWESNGQSGDGTSDIYAQRFTLSELAQSPTTHYRPSTPYTDSPFQTANLPELHLEDFQDNLINEPALTIQNHTSGDIISGGIAQEDTLTNGNRALQVNSTELTLEFAQSFTHVGLVITEIDPGSTATIEAFDSKGTSLGQSNVQTFSNTDDEFLGIANNRGIASVKISTSDNSWEVDHIQYG